MTTIQVKEGIKKILDGALNDLTPKEYKEVLEDTKKVIEERLPKSN